MRKQKNKWTIRAAILLLGATLAAGSACAQPGSEDAKEVQIPSGIDHSAWDRLLKKYVNEQGLVDYQAWKNSQEDRQALDAYLKQFAARPENPAKGGEKAAALVNAYNAIAIQTILEKYPVESIHEVDDPFKQRKWTLGGEKGSLNDIEHGSLRPAIRWQAHSVLVCAARSCPPLQRHAYRAGEFDKQVADAYTDWLARDDLNKFFPQENKAKLSKIFDWFRKDFEKSESVAQVIQRYGPPDAQKLVADGKNFEVEYFSYNWGLNDQGERGRNYTKASLIFDNIF